MLRYGHRWHDAANGPLHGEARLLWFAAPNPPAPVAPDPDEDPQSDVNDPNVLPTTEDIAAREAAQANSGNVVNVEQEIHRRRAINTLREEIPVSETPVNGEDMHARNIVSDAVALREKLTTSIERLQRASELAAGHPNETEFRREITSLSITIGALKKRMTDLVYPLTGDGGERSGLELDRWERGEMTPAEFLAKYEAYMGEGGELDTIDQADQNLSDAQRAERKAARKQLIDDARAAVQQAKERIPAGLSQNAVQRAVSDVSDKELWMKIYNADEKRAIMRSISEAAGLSTLKEIVADDISSIKEVYVEKNVDALIKKIQRSALEGRRPASASEGGDDAWQGGSYVNPQNVLSMIMAKTKEANDMLGIEWMTAYEWFDAFKEVWESIQELRKQKSRLRVSRAASTIGKAVSMIPGMGGEALVALLDQQQEAKNDEIKDGFVKELKNNRIDYGFKDLFGDGKGNQGKLAYYHQIGDTNRTRAILEFAAGKGMLYEITGKPSAASYILPGGISFSSLMPKEWAESQKDTYMSNLQFMNAQGIQAQTKAGEDFATGRSKFSEYVEPFEGAVNGLSLWFAKGIANKALTKVKEGEMSSTLTLIVCEAWENNDLFRRYVDLEWMDRLSGDSKQLLVGMIKYDKSHLHDGAKKFNERHIENADAFADDPEKSGNQRLGPLVNAVRSYLIDLDPTLKNNDEKTKARFRKLQAKLLACKRIGPKDDLPDGVYGSFFSDRLVPYHIQYDPNEIRDAAVDKLGDDNFIERSEIINTSSEVVQYIGTLRENGFAEPTKARYFFSQIIDAYDEMDDIARKPGPQQGEFVQARENFSLKQRSNLNLWIDRALRQNGAAALLTEHHSDQGLKGKPKRLLVLTLLEKGLISIDVIEKLAAENNKHANKLLKQYRESTASQRRGDGGAGSNRGANLQTAA